MSRINISIGGKWHFYDIVIAAAQAGLLGKFYTTIFFKNRRYLNNAFSQKLNFVNRSNPQIPADYVCTNAFPELIPAFLEKVGVYTQGQALRQRCELFDSWTNKVMDSCDIFHSQDGFCLLTAKRMKAEGTKFVCDRGIVSSSYLFTLAEEYKKVGINKSYPDCEIADRTSAEHELADVILVPTETVKISLRKEGIEGGKIKIIPYGVDLSLFKKIDLKRDQKFRVVFVGEISIRKGTHTLLQAWKSLRFTDAELLLIGKVEPGFEKLLFSYEGLYTHIPYTTQQDLVNYYSKSDVLVLPSLAEGSARVIYEAMACGLPVIYTDMSGSVARNGIDGFEISVNSTVDIMSRLTHLYENRDDAKKMGAEGALWIQNYSKENYRSNIQNVYKQILNG